jgi:hypothetical protein
MKEHNSTAEKPKRKPAPRSKPKADTVSASKLKRAFDRRTDLTRKEVKVVKQFVEKGKSIEKSFNSELLALAIEVKGIFASKTPGIPVHFEGCHYMTFDSFVEANFPICGRTMRRWLAEQGQTDQRFSNKEQQNLRDIASENTPGPLEFAEPRENVAEIIGLSEAEIRSAVGIPNGKPLPKNLRKAYEVGYRRGYDDGLADAQNRKGLA